MSTHQYRHLKLGTRKSLLALAQSGMIARAIEAKHPGVSVELVGMETQGDRVQDIPLSKIEGKEFFVAELDAALISGDVDLTVHSMKDLSLERPEEIALGAVPPRENPRDVVLFAPNAMSRLQAGKTLRIGTSSPRRIENVLPFLRRALPQSQGKPHLTAVEIRGNVNTRIGRLLLDDDAEKKVDAVVLAFAGLKRLWDDDNGRIELSKLLAELRWMILPLTLCPTAPAQGALAIECRSADQDTRDLLKALHDPATEISVARERQILKDWGGGCHQRFGATAVHIEELGSLLFIKGRKPDDALVDELRWESSRQLSAAQPAWDGAAWRNSLGESSVFSTVSDVHPDWLANAGALFLAHSRALPEVWAEQLAGGPQRVWTSGTESWFRLAEQGIWVEGCAEELGYDFIRPQLEEPLLNLPKTEDWRVLTHTKAMDGWPQQTSNSGEVIATYALPDADELAADHPAVQGLQQAEQVFWSSASQYALFQQWVPENAQHACRYGKTWYALQAAGLHDVVAYPNVSVWREQNGAEKAIPDE